MTHSIIRKQRRHDGFTLLELIVVVILSAILLTAVTSVMRVVLADAKPSVGSQASRNTRPLSQLAASQLRGDMMNARLYRLSQNRLDLRGMLSRQPGTQRATWSEAIVSYVIQPTQSGGLLVRRQQVPSGAESFDVPVWLGIESIRFSTSYVDDAKPASTVARAMVVDGWKWMPSSCRVELWGAGIKKWSESFLLEED